MPTNTYSSDGESTGSHLSTRISVLLGITGSCIAMGMTHLAAAVLPGQLSNPVVSLPIVGGGLAIVVATLVGFFAALVAIATVMGILESIVVDAANSTGGYQMIGRGGLVYAVSGGAYTFAPVQSMENLSHLGAVFPTVSGGGLQSGTALVAQGGLYLITAAIFGMLAIVTPASGTSTAASSPPTAPTTSEASRKTVRQQRVGRKEHSRPGTGGDSPSQDERGSAAFDPTEYEFDWQQETGLSFEDLAGRDQLKRDLERDIVKPFATQREKAARFDITAPDVLFYGPPGTGKSYTARALAGELELPIVSLSGADVQSKWVNESPQKVSQLFDEATTIANDVGGAVIFLDELDTVLEERGGAVTEASKEDDKVVNEFLAHLESSGDDDILFVGATNRREQLDEAAIRAGRIDKEIEVGLPDQADRRAILQSELGARPNDIDSDDLQALVEATSGYSAADLSSLVESAARQAAFERGGDVIQRADIQAVLDDTQ